MPQQDTVRLICEKVATSVADKGEICPQLSPETALLGGALRLDSLDLAAIVFELEQATGHDPFSEGFIEFRTIGELASLFDKG